MELQTHIHTHTLLHVWVRMRQNYAHVHTLSCSGSLSCTDVASKLFSACSSGDTETVNHLLANEPYAKTLLEMTNNSSNPNAKKVTEKTIYTAALKGHYDVVKLLLKSRANPNLNTGFGTPIYAAVKSGGLDLVRLLIEYGADYRTVRGGFSPLFVACIDGRLSILKYLVNIGANLYAFDNPPLIFTACSAGQLGVVKYLLEEMEFDVNRTIHGENTIKTDGKDTLLYCACSRSKVEVASYLVQQGALITQTIASRFSPIIKSIIHQKLRPYGKPEPVQMYHAKLKELGLAEIPWSFLAEYSTAITRLELRSNCLTSLPDQLFQMPSLKNLDISHNRLPEICQEEVAWECVRYVCLPSKTLSQKDVTSEGKGGSYYLDLELRKSPQLVGYVQTSGRALP